MSNLQKPCITMAALAFVASLVGCADEVSAPVEISAQVDRLMAVDLVTQEVVYGAEVEDLKADTPSNCRIEAYGMPNNVRLEGTLLKWRPDWDQVGERTIYFAFTSGCDDVIPTWLDVYHFEIEDLPLWYASDIGGDEEYDPTVTGVHDLE